MLKTSTKKRLTFYYPMLCILLLSFVHGTDDTVTNVTKSDLQSNRTKHCLEEESMSCESLSFGRREYVIYPNKTVYIIKRNLKLDECSYTIQNKKVVVCKSLIPQATDAYEIPCGVELALCIAICTVFLPIFFSMLTEDVRELIYVNWRGLILSLFFFHFLLQTVNIDKISNAPEFKYTFPSLMHFFTLVVLSWMTIMSHDGMMLSETSPDSTLNYMELMKNYRGQTLRILACIILLVTITLLTEVFAIVPASLKPETGDFCWITQKSLLIFFTGPVLAFSIINFFNFLSTYFYFTRHGNFMDGPLILLKQNYLIHFKLFAIMDITWLLGVLVFLAESEWLWRTFVCIFLLEEAFIIVVPFNTHLEKWVLDKLAGE